MVNNSTNINKTNNNFSPRENLNNDGQLVCFVFIGEIVEHQCLNLL
jgi:hypothetical protein